MERSARVGTARDVGPVSSAAGTMVVSRDPGAVIDFSGLNDTTLLAYGYRDRIDLFDVTDPDSQEGSGNAIHVLGDQSTVTTGDGGGNAIILSGRNDTVAGQDFPGSQDTVQAFGKGAVITVGGDSTVLLSGTDAHVTILGTRPGDSDSPLNDVGVSASGSGKATVTGGGAVFSFSGDKGVYVINGGDAEQATISGGAGSGVFTGGYYRTPYAEGPPGDEHYSYSGDNLVIAGAQRSTVVGSAHGRSTLVANGTAHDVLVAGEYGADTMSAGSSTVGNLYEGYSGPFAPTDDTDVPSLVVNAGRGNDTLVAGIAAETLTGGGGHDEFRFVSRPTGDLPLGGNATLITDFLPGIDKIDLRGFDEPAQQVVAGETVRGGSTSLLLAGGVHITLAHVTDLSVKDFTFSGT